MRDYYFILFAALKSKKYADIIIPNYGGGYSASF